MRTTAAVVPAPGAPFEIREIEVDDLRDDEVLVRIVASGLCHTDLTIAASYPPEMLPAVLGHEGAGVVEAVGPAVEGVGVGDHVVLSFRSCRSCEPCRAGDVGYCEQSVALNYMGMRLDGSTTYRDGDHPVIGSFFGQSSFAQHAIAYADNCVVVDKGIDLVHAAPFGCGYQTGAGTVLNVFDAGPDDSLAVFGVGAVGLAALAAGAARGVRTMVAIDLLPSRLEAAARYGAIGLDPADFGDEPGSTLLDRIKELTSGGARFGIDTTAIPAVVSQAMAALRPQGKLAALGLTFEDYRISATDLLHGGKTLLSTIEGESDPLTMVPHLLRMRDEGRFDVDPLVTTYPFAAINDAIADVQSGKTVKAVLTW
ncbi:MAG TPA: NAD(P)-dependent alcohol dehydrogenase [Microthrixaceae bacterium]|nr:NAD(P)-dependent alcohol dehydrogenase [Microthrixaceae bacterium]